MVKIGIVQMQSAPLHLDENLSRAEKLVSQAAGDGAELVVLPEMFSVGFSFSEELMGLAETLPEGETVRWLQEQCREHGISMITSLYERHEGHFYNTMVAVDPEGALQRYRKRNPTWFERAVWSRGDEPGPGIFDLPVGRVGGAICFDSFARETFEGFQQSKVDLVALVACWGANQPIPWRPDSHYSRGVWRRWAALGSRTVPRRYAQALGLPVVFVNQAGTVRLSLPRFSYPLVAAVDYELCGDSHVRDAQGEVLVRAEPSETDWYEVVGVELSAGQDRPEKRRIDIAPRYLAKEYYFVPPPFVARLGQLYYDFLLDAVYETRRKHYLEALAGAS